MANIRKGDSLANRNLVGTIEPKEGPNGKYYIVTAQLDLRDPMNRDCSDRDGHPARQTNPYLASSTFIPKGDTRERVGHGVIYTQKQVEAMLSGFSTRINSDTRKIEFAGKADLFYMQAESGKPTGGLVIQTKPETSKGRQTNMPGPGDFGLDDRTLANQAKMRMELIDGRKSDVAKGLQAIIDRAKGRSGGNPVAYVQAVGQTRNAGGMGYERMMMRQYHAEGHPDFNESDVPAERFGRVDLVGEILVRPASPGRDAKFSLRAQLDDRGAHASPRGFGPMDCLTSRLGVTEHGEDGITHMADMPVGQGADLMAALGDAGCLEFISCDDRGVERYGFTCSAELTQDGPQNWREPDLHCGISVKTVEPSEFDFDAADWKRQFVHDIDLMRQPQAEFGPPEREQESEPQERPRFPRLEPQEPQAPVVPGRRRIPDFDEPDGPSAPEPGFGPEIYC